jgi:hypothetical protein
VRTQRAGSLTQGLVGAWCPSLGATGFRLLDRSGRNNHCSMLNTAATSWRTSGGKLAFSHDGTDDRVFSSSFPMSIMSAANNSFSIWINPTSTNVSARIFSIGDPATFLARFNFQNLEFTFGGTAALVVTFVSTTYANRWTHICGVSDASGARLFIDGVQVGTRTDTVSLTRTASGLGIGYRFGVNSEFYPGLTDDFRLYARTLTHAEIRQLYIGGRGFGLLAERPRRRGTAAAATFKAFRARRQSQLIGGGL